MNKRIIGAAGESAALKIYLERGYCPVARNWHYRRFGEVDLILSYIENNDCCIVFCEVKLRQEKSLLTPAESVCYTKQNRIRKLAEIFIELNPQFANYNVRFDVAEVYKRNSETLKVRILADAF